jgi:chromosome segregation ATPase
MNCICYNYKYEGVRLVEKRDLEQIADLLDTKLDKKLEPIKSQVDENTRILKALVHSSEVSKAKMDKMSIDISHIQGDIEYIEKNISNVDENINVIKSMLGHHEVDIGVLKNKMIYKK